ncbi:MAG TPA: LuxR C-terminal-related transcriptional regulator [Sinomonas sp.]|nr:LuxR C-terminal-related transcriptional regulator [Sinomonas sp.]
MLFDREVHRVIQYANQATGVRIVGVPGSGRTTVAHAVVGALEATRSRVYAIFASPALESVPFAGVMSLGLDLRARATGILGMADVMSEHLLRPGPRTIVVDDVDSLDKESLSILHVVRQRTGAQMVITTDDAAVRPAATAEIIRDWPLAMVSLQPLRYEQVNSLATELLGGAVDVDLPSRVLSKSGGNLRLAVRIIETARLSERLIRRDGLWQMSGTTLLNPHLDGAIEALLTELDPEAMQALNTLAVLGPIPLSLVSKTVGLDVLARLEQRRLVTGSSDPHEDVVVAVSPPIVEDYLCDRISASGRIFQRRVSEAYAGVAPVPDDRGRAEATGLEDLRQEMRRSQAPAARIFHERLGRLVQSHFHTWEADPSMANAVAFLRVYWGAPIDQERVTQVFELTRVAGSEPADRLFFAMTRSLWEALNSEGLAGAQATMAQLAAAEPGWAGEAEAWSLLLEAFYSGMPEDLDERLKGLRGNHPSSGVTAVATGLLELYRFDPEAALRAMGTAVGFDSLPRVEGFIRGLATFATGGVDAALHDALELRAEALESVDQFTLVTQSYVATLCLLYKGLFDEAEYLMGSAFAMGRPGFLLESFHNAMLRLSSLRSPDSPSLADMAPAGSRDVGPLPGIGKGVFELVAQKPASPQAFDRDASQLLDEQLGHGFVFEALLSGLFFLCLLPGPEVLSHLRRILADRGMTHHDQLLAAAAAAIDGDLDRLTEVLDSYVLDSDAYQISMLLRSAARESQLRGNAAIASGIDAAAAEFGRRFPTGGQFMAFEPRSAAVLTDREKQVALLAGEASNQEIAEHLGIGIRTIESHVSKAMRKTNTKSRRALSDLIRAIDESKRAAR